MTRTNRFLIALTLALLAALPTLTAFADGTWD